MGVPPGHGNRQFVDDAQVRADDGAWTARDERRAWTIAWTIALDSETLSTRTSLAAIFMSRETETGDAGTDDDFDRRRRRGATMETDVGSE